MAKNLRSLADELKKYLMGKWQMAKPVAQDLGRSVREVGYQWQQKPANVIGAKIVQKTGPIGQFMAGFPQGASGYLISPQSKIYQNIPQPTTIPQKIGRFAGGLTGFAMGPGKVFYAPIEGAVTKFTGQQLSKAPLLARKLIPGLAAESISSAAFTPIRSVIEKKPLKQTYKEELAAGLTGRAAFGGLGLPFMLAGALKQQNIKIPGVDSGDKKQYQKFITNAYKVATKQKDDLAIADIAKYVSNSTDTPGKVYAKIEAIQELYKKHPDKRNLDFNKLLGYVKTLNFPERINELTREQRISFVKRIVDQYGDAVNRVIVKPVLKDQKTYLNTSYLTDKKGSVKKLLSEGRPVPSSPVGVGGRYLPTSQQSKPILPSMADLSRDFNDFLNGKIKDTMNVPYATKGVGGARIKEIVKTQTAKILPQLPEVRIKGQAVSPPIQVKPGASKAVSQVPSTPIIPQKEKYAFNINKPKLGLKGEAAKKLDDVVEKMKPVLEIRKGAPLTEKEIITGGRKAKLLDEVMGRDQAKEFANRLQATRNFVRTASQQKGVTPEYLAQLEILSSTAADTGRRLKSFATAAEDADIKELILRDLQKLGIETQRLVEASKNVDWNDAGQVTEFYRKFKPASFLDKLQEYRYVNMLSGPNTHIINTFGNFLQSAIVTPAEYTIRGQLDFVRARLTGKEQKYFADQGVDFAKGFWKSLPEAWGKFRKVLKGEGGLLKPDIEFIPSSTSKLHKIYTAPLRSLEAADQFFRTMIMGGEKASLVKSGLSEADIAKKAVQAADYRTFRQAFDPEGKLGQGGLLKIWDKWNVGVNQLRRLPGGKWVVPFLQTPTNILKQGVEYSPIGVATMPGAKEPIEQLAKAMLGSSVFVGAYALANSGLTTWDTPAKYKDRQKFYDAGLQPYSVKIGDTWYSYSKLGPISYPIAMAAAMKWAKDNGADDSLLKTAGMGIGGFLQFFADQSYMQGIGDVIDAVRGDEFKQGRALANIPSQIIPYRALQGWIARLVDPIYRKSTGGSVSEQMIKSIKSQVPFASKTLEPYTNLSGQPSERSLPYVNAVSPIKVSKERYATITPSGQTQGGTTIKAGLPKETEDLKVLYKDAMRTVDNYRENKTKAQYGLVQKDLSEYQAEFDQAYQIKKRIEQERPEQVFDIQVETYSSGGGMTVEERAGWVAKQLEGKDEKTQQELINKLWDSKVITKGNNGVAAYLEDTLGVDVWNYTGIGKNKGKTIKTKKPKKITAKKLSPAKIKFAKIPKSKVTLKALKKAPVKFKVNRPKYLL